MMHKKVRDGDSVDEEMRNFLAQFHTMLPINIKSHQYGAKDLEGASVPLMEKTR